MMAIDIARNALHIGAYCFCVVFDGAFADNNQQSTAYEVVIVGGGLSGLSTAYGLKHKKTLILEKQSRLGGRVETNRKTGITYELGALFSYPKNLIPFDFVQAPLILEGGPVGFHYNGKLYFGQKVSEAIDSLFECPRREYNGDRFTCKSLGMKSLSAVRHSLNNAFFNVIHPGNIGNYILERKSDAFTTWNTDHYLDGNLGLIEEFTKRLNAEISLNSNVISVQKKNDHVVTVYLKERRVHRVTSRAVVVATQANVANKIIADKNSKSSELLSSVKYGSGMVVVIGLRNSQLKPFRYLVTPGSEFNTVFMRKTSQDGTMLLTVYYTGEAAIKFAGKNKAVIVERTISQIARLGVGNINLNDILFTDVKFWKELGTIINTQAYENFSDNALVPAHGVFLVGDYTFWSTNKMPYGMAAAIKSGIRSAKLVEEFLETPKID